MQVHHYNEVNTSMSLFFSAASIKQLCSILHILSIPMGHALLIGEGGIGRKSLTKLAAFIAGCSVFQTQVGDMYM